MAKNTNSRKVRITDTTLRDAHQSLWATRMRTDDILAIAEKIDSAGYYSLECWGGATFDVCMRFLRENPWERLRRIKAVCRRTPLQMLLRGQNILGYKHYPDDVVDRFVALACENGMDIFRVFDALNDPRNLETAIRAVKKYGGHAQGTISYTTSPVHTVESYVALAREQAAMGIDSLAIKDMAGILTPGAARELVGALVKALPDMPIQVHSHMTSGMAAAMYMAAVEAGAGCVDTAISTLSSFSSQPPCESVMTILESEGFDTGLDRAVLGEINAYFMDLKKKRQPASSARVEAVDAGVLVHAIPGGMISNLRSQLAQQGALDRLDDVLAELPRTRADMGYPPLVTPTSQIVGVQSVLNVLSGRRYSMVTDETRHYAAGYYGRTPAPIDRKLRKKLMGDLKPIDCRPADLLKPGLSAAADEIPAKLIQAEEDILSYCLFPEVALDFFKWRAKPEGERDPIPADLEMQKAEAEKAAAPALDEQTAKFASIGRAFASLMAACGGTGDLNGLNGTNGVNGLNGADVQEAGESKKEPEDQIPAGEPVLAPLNGTFYRSAGPGKPELAADGATVKAGEPCCIVEAMKLFNPIKAPVAGKITFLVKHGTVVVKGQTLAVVA
ncbi:MAG: pyruvate carboxylase subunit B [Kiritimatiellae bacterium]|nr:pyruvate carboxylase subunit B [Kiritimatiellia bacterium]